MRCPYLNTDRQQCTRERHDGGEHDFRPREAAPLAGRVTSAPRCPGCGTSTAATVSWPSGAPCEICVQRPRFQAPQATTALGAQPEPAYQRADYRGNFPPPAQEE